MTSFGLISSRFISVCCKEKHLSYIINDKFNLNFYDFINKYRIEESKQYLNKSSNIKTVLEIAYKVGFNSKTTFNSAFKKYTDMTPSEFRKMNK